MTIQPNDAKPAETTKLDALDPGILEFPFDLGSLFEAFSSDDGFGLGLLLGFTILLLIPLIWLAVIIGRTGKKVYRRSGAAVGAQ